MNEVCVENDANEYAFQECDDYWVEWSNADDLVGPIGQPPCALYHHIGVENVTVVWQNQCGLDTTIQSFTISNQPDFSADTVCEGNATTMAAFTACEFNTYTSWAWNFHDGTTGSGQTVSHIFNGAGNHWVTLTVTDACGNTETHSEWINVKPVPQTNAELSFYTNCDTDTITGTILNPDADCLYNWFASPASAVTFITGNTGTSVIFVTINAALTSPTYIIITTTDSVTGCKGLDTLLFYPCCNIPADSSWSEENISTSGAYSYNQFVVNGTVNFNSDQTFTNCMFYFGPMAKITMSPGVEVQFHECALVAGCEYMWDGIYVDSPFESLIMDSCKVRDAINSVYSTNNGYYELRHNDFRQNYISLYVKESQPGFGAVMSGNMLYMNSLLMYPPYTGSRGFAGVKTYHAASVNIGPGNEFDKLFNGIWAEKSQLIVKGNLFKNINTMTVFNVSTGAIYMDGGHGASNSFIWHTSVIGGTNAAEGNSFQNCLNGVVAKNPQKFEILNNDFSRVTMYAVKYSFLNKACQAEIRNNSFTNCATGIYAYLNTRCNSTIANNTMNWTGNPLSATGIRVLGDKFENERYYILSNTISKPKYGIDIQTTYGTLVQDNTIEDLRTSSGLLKNYGIRSLNCYKPVISSNTITPVPFNGNQPGASSDINTGIQIENTWAATLNCNVIRKTGTALVISGANPMATITNNDFVKSYYGIYTKNSGYTGDLGNDTHPADNQWVGIANLRQQYKYPHNGYEIMYCRNIPGYLPFYHIYAPYSQFTVSVAPSITICPQAIIDDPTEKAKKTITQDIYQIPNESRIWVKKGMNKIVKNNSLLYSDSLLSEYIDTLSIKATGLFDSVLVLRENELIADAELLNNIVAPDNYMEELEKEMNQYYVKLDLNVLNIFSSAEIDRIHEIAMMCPFTEGEAVYRARILAASFDSVETEYINNCEVEIEERLMISQSENIQIDILVVPNPAMNEIAFSCDDSNEEGILHLYDLSGRCVWNGSIILNSSRINIADLSNGLYHYSLLIGNNVYNGHFTKMSD